MASPSRKMKKAQTRETKRFVNASSRGGSLRRLRNFAASATAVLVVLTLPILGIAGGEFTQVQDGKTTIYNQSSSKVYNRVNSYNIMADETHRYNQPSGDEVFVQRVTGGQYSSILGQLIANGQVWIMNPGGVLIGPDASVNTAGFMATSLVMGEDDFFAGRYILNSEGTDSFVINKGSIISGNGGYAILAGGAVANQGYISADAGEVVLASGRKMTIDFAGDGLVNFAVDEKTVAKVMGPDGEDLTSAVLNTGLIAAPAGRVVLTAKAASDILDSVVNNAGVIEAKSVAEQNGEIILSADAGNVISSGTLDVSGYDTGEKGGSVKILGENVGLVGQAVVDASGDAGGGKIVIGGDYHGAGPDPNAAHSYVGGNARIEADAITTGDGGKIVIWSDEGTSYYGSISARGGAVSGNGGFVEVSGKEGLSFDGKVDLSAANGLFGTLLLDPLNIFINGTGHTAGNTNVIPSQLGNKAWNATIDYDVSDTAIATALTTANVTLAASQNISTAAPVLIDPNNATAINTRTLTLSASNNIIIANPFVLTNSAAATGPRLVMTATNGIQLGSAVTTKGATVSLNNAVTLTGDSLVDTTLGGTVTGNRITFGSTINGPWNLDLEAGSGGITVSGIIGTAAGDVNSLASLIANGGAVGLNNVFTSGNQAVTGTAITLNGTSYRSTGGSLLFAGPTALNNNATVTSSGLAGDGITFDGTINGAQSFNLQAGSGDVLVTGIVGTSAASASRLASFTAAGANVNLNSVFTSGAQAVTGTSIIGLNGTGYTSTAGSETFTGPVQLQKDVTVTGVNTTFTGTIDGNQRLTVNDSGATTFGGIIGGTDPLTSVITDAPGTTAINGGAVT
ncbi:MAG: filamentous hemagglutinin N-terminal domain-containing protein, partial [Smithellaceae bacterium]|nr:filamentous hemagglutinin N-terminal domain-containing protein [Smithellaceae bacterium]